MNIHRLTSLISGVSGNIVTLLFLFGIIPLTLMSLICFYVYLDNQKKAIADMQKEMVQRISSTIETHLDKRMETIDIFAMMIDPATEPPSNIKAWVHRFMESCSEYDETSVMNDAGEVWLKQSIYYTYKPSEYGNAVDLPGFKKAMTGKKYIGPVSKCRYCPFPIIEVFVPIGESSIKVSGVLRVALNLSAMPRLISNDTAGNENSEVYVVDKNGILIAGRDVALVLQKKNIEDIEIVKKISGFSPEVFEYKGLNEESVIGAGSRVSITGWRVVVETPTRMVYRDMYMLLGFLVFGFYSDAHGCFCHHIRSVVQLSTHS